MTTDVIQVEDLGEEGNVIATKMVQLQDIATTSTRDQILHAIKTSKWIINALSILYLFVTIFPCTKKRLCRNMEQDKLHKRWHCSACYDDERKSYWRQFTSGCFVRHSHVQDCNFDEKEEII